MFTVVGAVFIVGGAQFTVGGAVFTVGGWYRGRFFCVINDFSAKKRDLKSAVHCPFNGPAIKKRTVFLRIP